MSKLFFAFLLTFSFGAAVNAANPGKDLELKVKTDQSGIAWTAQKVTGKHNGSVAIKEGSLKLKNDVLVGGSFTMDMTSITVLDLEGKGKDKLEGHLKSDDFFSVNNHPTATLVVTEAVAKGNGMYNIKADLTIKGITQPVEFIANVDSAGDDVKATADIKIDRTLYDVRYGSGKFFENLGDNTIYDDFNLHVTLVAGKA